MKRKVRFGFHYIDLPSFERKQEHTLITTMGPRLALSKICTIRARGLKSVAACLFLCWIPGLI